MRAPTKVLEDKRTTATFDPGTRLKNRNPHGTTSTAICSACLRDYSGRDHDGRCNGDRTHQLTNFNTRFVEEWLFAWGIAFLTMLPIVIFVAPFIQRCVLALTLSTAGDGLN
jgi:hypothetical protein